MNKISKVYFFHAFRSIEFVSAYRHEIDLHVVDVDGDLADGLRGVSVEENL